MHYQITDASGKPVSGIIYDLTRACEKAKAQAIARQAVLTVTRCETKPIPKVTKLATYATDGAITIH